MAYKVKADITIPELGKVPTCFTVSQNGTKLGELKISKGGVEYVPKGNSKTTFNRSWKDFHNLIVGELER